MKNTLPTKFQSIVLYNRYQLAMIWSHDSQLKNYKNKHCFRFCGDIPNYVSYGLNGKRKFMDPEGGPFIEEGTIIWEYENKKEHVIYKLSKIIDFTNIIVEVSIKPKGKGKIKK